MDVIDIWHAIRRQWIIVTSLIVLVLGASCLTYFSSDSKWTSSGNLVLVPTEPVIQGGNATENAITASGGPRLIGNVLMTALNEPGTKRRLLNDDAIDYVAEASPQLPTVKITLSGPTQDAVQQGMARVVGGANGVLNAVQQDVGVVPSAYYRASSFAVDQAPTEGSADRNRAALFVAAGGIFLLIAAAVVVDQFKSPTNHRRPKEPSPRLQDAKGHSPLATDRPGIDVATVRLSRRNEPPKRVTSEDRDS